MKKTVCALFFALLLIICGGFTSNGIKSGLDICGAVLIPSLFPFLIFTAYLNECGFVSTASRLLKKPARILLKSGGEEAAVLLISLLSGYPAGASMLGDMAKNGDLPKERAKTAAYYCCGAGPAFVFTALGQGILRSNQSGVILLCCHITASLITAAAVSRAFPPAPSADPTGRNIDRGGIVRAVTKATASMLSVCAFVIAFSAISGVLANIPMPKAVAAAVSCVCEVTNGCVALSPLTDYLPFYAAAAGFGGISVILQLCACAGNLELSLPRLIGVRAFHAAVSFVLCSAVCIVFPPVSAAYVAAPKSAAFVYTPTLSLAMILMCAVYSASVLKASADNGEK